MQITQNRLARLIASAAVVALPLGACAAVGGGGDAFSDCDSDVSGSELTPVATADFEDEGTSCNNNQFVDTDLDAFAYPESDDASDVGVWCKGDFATWRLFDVTNGAPDEINSGDCDGDAHFTDNADDNLYVLVIEHAASSEGANFEVATENDP